jgi:hypothetical protein
MGKINIRNHMEDILLPSSHSPTVISCWSFSTIGGTPTVPMMHLVSQPSTSSPSTPAYNPNSGGSTSTSYTSYGSSPQNNPYFPFLVLPNKLLLHQGQPHVSVNFVHPSPIQQVQTFEQLNMENLAHQPNNSKKKGKNLKQ